MLNSLYITNFISIVPSPTRAIAEWADLAKYNGTSKFNLTD